MTTDGQSYAGVSVENSSTGLTADALRVAIGRAAASIGSPFKISNIAIAQIDKGKPGRELSPARLINPELLWEFGAKNAQVAVACTGQRAVLYKWQNGLMQLAR